MKFKTLFNVVQSKIASLRYPYFRAKSKVNFQKPRIKLVAIAKNESAYLPEWIYHHLYFGFDQIEIHYNGCTDSTLLLSDELNEHRVSFFNADPIFAKSQISPQMDIYRPEFAKSRSQGFDHVMFLDIDEFWIPLDLSSSIKDFIKESPYFDSMSFQWANKVDESVSFSRAIGPCIQVEPARQLKSIHKTFITPGIMNPHNVIDDSLIRILADGKPFIPSNEHHSKAPTDTMPEKAFILHRKYRSQIEYIALLGRGRPIGPEKISSEFKNNRDGYYIKDTGIKVAFSNTSFHAYNRYMSESLAKLEQSKVRELSKQSVIDRYHDVVKAIKLAPKEELPTLTKILKNVDIEEVRQAFEEFKQRIS